MRPRRKPEIMRNRAEIFALGTHNGWACLPQTRHGALAARRVRSTQAAATRADVSTIVTEPKRSRAARASAPSSKKTTARCSRAGERGTAATHVPRRRSRRRNGSDPRGARLPPRRRYPGQPTLDMRFCPGDDVTILLQGSGEAWLRKALGVSANHAAIARSNESCSNRRSRH